MFRLSCALALMGILPLAAKADVVVLQNLSAPNGSSISGDSNFSINFNTISPTQLTSITLYNTRQNLSNPSISWKLNSSTAQALSGSLNTNKTLINNGTSYYGYDFNLNNSSFITNNNATNTLSTTNLNTFVALSGWSIAGSGTVSSNSALGFSNASYDQTSPNYNFELAAVPEPGTLALGALAAIAGAVAWWWRQVWFPLG